MRWGGGLSLLRYPGGARSQDDAAKRVARLLVSGNLSHQGFS